MMFAGPEKAGKGLDLSCMTEINSKCKIHGKVGCFILSLNCLFDIIVPQRLQPRSELNLLNSEKRKERKQEVE